jgi:lysophospholipid acyltransferase (LPLAT)-like uncharacterized protein
MPSAGIAVRAGAGMFYSLPVRIPCRRIAPVKIRSRWLTKCLTWIVAKACLLLFATCRKVLHTPDPQLRFAAEVDDGDDQRYITLVWHDSLLFPTFGGTQELRNRTSCLTSRHHDGSYIAEMMNWLGIKAVRGSTNHGGAAAIRQMMDNARDRHVVITPDGPRGPRRVLQPGAVFLASQSGRKLCVTAFSCVHGWRLKGKWTDLLIPRPFTTIHLLIAPLIDVPPDLSRAELDRYVQRAQTALDGLNAAAEDYAAGREPAVAETLPVQRAA